MDEEQAAGAPLDDHGGEPIASSSAPVFVGAEPPVDQDVEVETETDKALGTAQAAGGAAAVAVGPVTAVEEKPQSGSRPEGSAEEAAAAQSAGAKDSATATGGSVAAIEERPRTLEPPGAPPSGAVAGAGPVGKIRSVRFSITEPPGKKGDSDGEEEPPGDEGRGADGQAATQSPPAATRQSVEFVKQLTSHLRLLEDTNTLGEDESDSDSDCDFSIGDLPEPKRRRSSAKRQSTLQAVPEPSEPSHKVNFAKADSEVPVSSHASLELRQVVSVSSGRGAAAPSAGSAESDAGYKDTYEREPTLADTILPASASERLRSPLSTVKTDDAAWVLATLASCAMVVILGGFLVTLIMTGGGFIWAREEFAKPLLAPHAYTGVRVSANLSPENFMDPDENDPLERECLYYQTSFEGLLDEITSFTKDDDNGKVQEVTFAAQMQNSEVVRKVQAYWFPAPEDSKTSPSVVIMHAGTSGAVCAPILASVYFLRRSGFNVLVPLLDAQHYDLETPGKKVYAKWTYEGAQIAHDAWRFAVDRSQSKNPGQVALMGFGLGAYIATMAFGMEPEIPGLLVDSPVVSIEELLETVMSKQAPGIAWLFKKQAWMACKSLAGPQLETTTPATLLRSSTPVAPWRKVAVIHGVGPTAGAVPVAQGRSFVALMEELDVPVTRAWFPTIAPDGSGCDLFMKTVLAYPRLYKYYLCEFFSGVFGRDPWKSCGKVPEGYEPEIVPSHLNSKAADDDEGQAQAAEGSGSEQNTKPEPAPSKEGASSLMQGDDLGGHGFKAYVEEVRIKGAKKDIQDLTSQLSEHLREAAPSSSRL
eukprot:TRINITY_DN70884_c0_g1_i1.p1 TRINITY_DN70884_c0_g1~~TRINITY_DN70884_c0_g1_i1.p1  ORF type:complete len:816 (+),score=148.06 TRINITY_DN70884_c0_g1_i1:164-2611(+)